MKKTFGLLFTLALGLAACSTPLVVDQTDAATTETLNTSIDSPVERISLEQPVDTSGSSLSAAEVDGLLLMREEEKLARDVYLTLYDQWNLNMFRNIASSESTHMDAILALLVRYGLEDPAADQGVGEFSNPALQALYDQLVAQGEQSLSDAIKVGAMIEEIDIRDLEEQIAQTQMTDIVSVYESLAKGSRNHLRSFTKTLEQQTGEVYAPQYLDRDTYEAIVSSELESGSQSNGRQNGKGNKNGSDL